jgi:NOL1/NOP2/fmu family ribosome biogenesis protein
MQQLEILNSKRVKEILALINEQWGCEWKTDLVFLLSSNDKIHVVSRGLEKLDTERMKIDSLGMYFAAFENNELRLSIEGSQLIGPMAKHNVVEFSDEETRQWIAGGDIEKDTEWSGFVLIKHNKDFLGTGRVKEKKILNYFPKSRRVGASASQ